MTNLKNYLSVAFFAFFGGIARATLNSNFNFYGTFIGNITGCFLLTFFTYLFIKLAHVREWLNVGICTGFIGAFTTFSTFTLDTLKQIEVRNIKIALIYFFSSVIAGLAFAFLGKICGTLLGKLMIKEYNTK